MTGIHQISVFLENRAGSLSEITRVLAESGVNLRALSIAESADYGVLRIIADDAEKATSTLLEKGCVLSMTPVSVVGVPDEPAGLSQLLAVLEEKNVNIEYMYALITTCAEKAFTVMRTDDSARADEILTANGIELLDEAHI